MFPDGSLPAGVSVSGDQIAGPLSESVSVSGNQITGPITNATLNGGQVIGALSSSATIPGSQVTGPINATQVVGTVTSALSAATASGLTCPTTTPTIPSCYTFSGTVNGTIASNVAIPGGQVQGYINATGVVFDGDLGPNACSDAIDCVFKSLFTRASNAPTCNAAAATGLATITCPSPIIPCDR